MDKLELDLQKEQNAIQNLETLLNSLTNAVDDLLNARENVSSDTTQAAESDLETIKTAEKTILNLGYEWDDVIKLLTHNNLISTFNSKFQSILDLADTKNSSDTGNTKTVNTDGLNKLQTLSEQAENMLNKSGFILEKTILALEAKFQQQIQTLFQQMRLLYF